MSTTTTTDLHPIGIASLPEGATACASCGLPVAGRSDSVLRRVLGREIEYGPGRGSRVDSADLVLTFARCSPCAERHALAAEVAVLHRPLLALGSTSITADRLAFALDALAAVGALQSPTEAEAAEALYRRSYPATRSLLERLSDLGAAVQWASRFSPVWQADALKDTCASEAWLFVPSDTLTDIRRQVGEHLRDRMPPRPIACPSGGCAVCGHASVDARRPSEAWTAITSGKYAGGHLCPADAALLDEEGSISYSLLERSVCDVVDPDRMARRKRPHAPDLQGITAWADERTPGSRLGADTRWSHVNLDALRALLFHGEW